MSTDPLPPRPFARPDARPPIHRRTTDAFEKLVRLEQSDCLVTRIASQFLGTDGAFRHLLTFGKLRTALLWDALPGFLDEEGWQVAGAIGFSDGRRGEDLAVPEFESLRLGDDLWLELPKNLQIFLERGEERAVVRFTAESVPGGFLGVGALHLDNQPKLLERWLEYAQQHNALRGRKLLADGRLAPRLERAEDGRLFLPAAVRARVEFAVRRFTSPEARRLGLRRRAGLILAGPPGTGKSSIGRELAEKLPCTFLWVTPGDLKDAEDVHEVFEIARWLAPTVLFLEDLDLIAQTREQVFRGGPLLGPLMNELDGAAGDRPILTIATTNRLEVVEAAVRNRPGRFDQILKVEPPDAATRRELLAHRLRLAEVSDEDLTWAVAELDGATGAEIEEVANGAIAASVLEREDWGTPAESAEAERIAVRREHLQHALENVARPSEHRAVGFAKEG